MTRLVCALVCLLIPLESEIIDRLAIAVGHEVVTELQLDEELRVTALLNHKPVVRDLEQRREAADRLVEQLLIKLDMELSHYQLPSTADVESYYQQIEESDGGPADFDKMLSNYNLTADTVRSHLELQLAELKFIDLRFRPDVTVTDAEVETAYRRQVTDWKASHTGPPPSLEVSRDPLRAMLVEEQIDAALNSWLAESRKRVRLIYFDKALE